MNAPHKRGIVALVGRPNAGKSTLLNRLVGQKLAIVSDKPQTTRNRIVGVRHYPGGEVVYVDTPGIHRPLHRLNVRMMDAATDSLADADLVLVVVDVSEPSGAGDRFLMDMVSRVRVPRVLALNKVDGLDKIAVLPRLAAYDETKLFSDLVPVSALTGENVDRLETCLLAHLPEGEAIYPDDYLTDQPERFFVAELVREQVLQQTHDELPFSTAVVVDRFEEGPLLRLYCTILVERDSQKPIIIGRAGATIKAVGIAARHELEAFFQTPVFLDLHVKVRGRWREDDRTLGELGLQERRRPSRRS
ncbi:MAG: GTPase Era [Acidobacteria bacterium]|nr:GTPase Era [Acidobacteriota bacterium]